MRWEGTTAIRSALDVNPLLKRDNIVSKAMVLRLVSAARLQIAAQSIILHFGTLVTLPFVPIVDVSRHFPGSVTPVRSSTPHP